ncbi:MAG: hypothetical protein AMJ70_04685 [Dehalococcoidia bacterium SG8_51_3]|nr:MAG: hypothetical protein AMJ70_04685 [Dehalococcoidia bacterium SG8_51_3]
MLSNSHFSSFFSPPISTLFSLAGFLDPQFLQKVKQNRCGGCIFQIEGRKPQGLDGLVEFADPQKVITQKKLQVPVEAVEFGFFSQPVHLFEENIIFRIQSARIKDAFLFGRHFRQGCSKDFGSLCISLSGKKRLTVCKGKYDIIRCKLHCLGKKLGGPVVIIKLESPDSVFEVAVRQRRLGRFQGLLRHLLANIRESRVVNNTDIIRRTVGCNYRSVIVVVVIGIVVMSVTYDFACDRIVTVPTVRMTAIPVITAIAVIPGPVSAQADK